MNSVTLKIGLRAAALSYIGWTGLFGDVRAQSGCYDDHECRGEGGTEYCAIDANVPGDSSCYWAMDWVDGFQCLTGSGSCDGS